MEGIKNSIIRDKFVEEIAEKRLNICNTCVRKDDSGKYCTVKGTQPCCNLCGCSLSLKTRSLSSSCPDMKWNAIITEDDEDKLMELE